MKREKELQEAARLLAEARDNMRAAEHAHGQVTAFLRTADLLQRKAEEILCETEEV